MKYLKLIAVIFLWINGYVFANIEPNNKLFPLPDNLRPNVKFWIKVYTKYDNNQFLIHDSEDLNIIYEIITIENNNISEKRKWKQINKIKDDYRKILKKLAKKRKIRPESLTEKERYVYKLFPPNTPPGRFALAATQIRAQQGLRSHFKRGLIRSGRYMQIIIETLKKYNLPLELAALPHVESSFNNRAYSKFGAAGLWQFTRRTGRLYLKINYTVDERFDPIKATDAAARLLKHNYEELGSWPLALNAYNHGVNGLKRAIKKLGTTDIGKIAEKYRSRRYGFASRNFYTEFLAALHISKNYKMYFGDIQFDKPLEYQEIELPYYVRLSTIKSKLNISTEEIKRLNPSLRRSVLISNRRLPKGFKLHIPPRKNFNVDEFFAQIPASERRTKQIKSDWYRVRRGDNLKKIARKFNTTVEKLLALNDDIQDIHRIYVNQIIRVVENGSKETPEKRKLAEKSAPPQKLPAKPKLAVIDETTKPITEEKELTNYWYEIKPGDNLNKIAKKYGVSVRDIIKVNHIENSNQIRVGQTLIIPRTSEKSTLMPAEKLAVNIPIKKEIPVQDETPKNIKKRLPLDSTSFSVIDKIYVMPDETLGHYADWLEIPTQKLRDLNGFSFHQEIQLGQQIKIIYINVTKEEFQQRRMEYHRSIEEDFFASYQVDGVIVHKLKKGENIWYLSNEVYEVPYWLLIKYNPNIDFNRLHKGDEIIIPIITSNKES